MAVARICPRAAFALFAVAAPAAFSTSPTPSHLGLPRKVRRGYRPCARRRPQVPAPPSSESSGAAP